MSLLWWVNGWTDGQVDQGAAPTSTPTRTTGGSASTAGTTDPESGLVWVALGDLPTQAARTVRLIDAGGPFPYTKDGSVFGNNERLPPKQRSGFYREYTVPTRESPTVARAGSSAARPASSTGPPTTT